MNPSSQQAAGYPVANGTSSFCGFPHCKQWGIPAAKNKFHYEFLVIKFILSINPPLLILKDGAFFQKNNLGFLFSPTLKLELSKVMGWN